MTGIILAGGRSTRMGRDKALVPIHGIPMALRAASTLKLGGCKEIHVVGRQTALMGLGLSVISDGPNPKHHPLLGVAAALEAVNETLVLIAPCDLINIEPEHIRCLLSVGGPCVASAQGQVHPLLAVLPTHLALRARALAEQGRPAMDLVEGVPRVELPPPSLNDANRPADLPR
jgi:molybdopterin-guanine dinucleotide biosynthesis protein A